MIVTIHFHGPFRIGTGDSRPGLGATVDRTELVPTTSLKGVMRASAERLLLPKRPDVVRAVFGAPRQPSPWHWGPVEFAGGPAEPGISSRARVELDPQTGTAIPSHLVVAEEVTVPSATARFAVERFDVLPAGLDESTHLAVLACAAAGVHELGAGRSRGLGWISCTTADPTVDDETLDVLEGLLAQPTPEGGTG
ncbi:RAMP superfamily CRISPR-associated protein [Streptomyces sp. NPDC020845]|uniref:RAMP superfamily CRISPR-associated protein n=1 Tax=Streptomyces sp. NPDC020845 TaxID=3365096 RepID=UPI0037ABFDF0